MAEAVILGAGIAGLAAAYAFDYKFPIYEKNEYAGGLCHSFQVHGFTFDTAVHFSFTKSEQVRAVFDQADTLCHHPYPVNWYQDRWIKHPIQNNLYALDVDKRVQALMGFINRPSVGEVNNLKEWLIHQFGTYIYENFAGVYNKKYWCEELYRLDTDWIGSKLYQPSLEEAVLGSFTDETQNTYYASEMRYPKKGGYFSFAKPMADRAQIHFGKQAVKIDTKQARVHFSDGETVAYSRLFSSIPLPEVVSMLEYVPDHVRKATEQLRYTSVALVSIGFSQPNITDAFWFYIYDQDIWASRVYSPSNKSPNNVPEGCSSLQFEIYFNATEKAPSADDCIENCVEALSKMGIATGKQILFTDFRIAPFANVIMLQDVATQAQIIRNYLQENGIEPIGRFGEWKYAWSDQAFLSGYGAVKEYLGGKSE